MTEQEILAVAARCETESPGPYLASAILVAAGHQTLFRGDKIGWEWRKDGVGVWSSMPRPDLSLDAAVTLVPEGFDWMVRARGKFNAGVELGEDWAERHPPKSGARVWKMATAGLYAGREGSDAATPVAALCAAALRARAAITKAKGPAPAGEPKSEGR